MTSVMKDMFCKTVRIKMLCAGHSGGGGGGGGGSSKCSGPNCCQESSCYSNSVPFAKCKGSRGPAKCVGGGFPMTKGVCQCKYGSCTASGTCPSSSQGMGGMSRLYDDSMTIPAVDEEEDHYTLAERIPFAFLFTGLFGMVVVFGLRINRVVQGDATYSDGFDEDYLEGPQE